MALEIKGLFNPTSVSIPTSHLAEIMDGGEEPTDSFTVTKNLSHCAISNEQIGEASYYAEIAPTGGWSDLQVTIKVGGVDMSEYYSSGVINIPNVTGNIVITATAAAAPLVSIAATYTQSGTVYDTDTLDSLKADLVVTANYDNGTSSVVTTYTLSGTLTEGTSTITVSYGGKTATFNVVVTESIPYTLYDYVYAPSGATGVFVNTGLTHSPSWNTLNMEMEVLNNNGTSSTDGLMGASAYQSTGTATFTWYFRQNRAGFSTFALGASGKLENVPSNTRAIIKYHFNDGQQSYIESGENTANIATIAKTSIATGQLSLILAGGYKVNDGSQYGMSAGLGDKLGYVKFTDPENNDALLYHFIPAYDPATTKYGFYEAVHGIFYPSNGGLMAGNWS